MSLNQKQLRMLRELVVEKINDHLQWVSVTPAEQIDDLREKVDRWEALLRELDTQYNTLKEMELCQKER